MSACLWVLGDVFRVVVLDCLLATHLVKQRVLTSQWAESHNKMIVKLYSLDVTVEEFEEVFVEVVEPFVE